MRAWPNTFAHDRIVWHFGQIKKHLKDISSKAVYQNHSELGAHHPCICPEQNFERVFDCFHHFDGTCQLLIKGIASIFTAEHRLPKVWSHLSNMLKSIWILALVINRQSWVNSYLTQCIKDAWPIVITIEHFTFHALQSLPYSMRWNLLEDKSDFRVSGFPMFWNISVQLQPLGGSIRHL